jgi:hypothetical protein
MGGGKTVTYLPVFAGPFEARRNSVRLGASHPAGGDVPARGVRVQLPYLSLAAPLTGGGTPSPGR